MKKENENMIPHIWQVVSNTHENHDTFTIVMRPSEGGKFSFEPGQFTMLYAHGVGEMPISISGDPTIQHTLTQTIKLVGKGTMALQKLEAGSSIGVRGPFGTAWPMHKIDDRDAIIVTGGIGLAPLRPVIYHLASIHKERSEKKLRTTVIYGARSPQDRIYADEVEKWEKLTGWDFITTVDKPDPGWKGKTGLVTNHFPATLNKPLETIVMSCGPEIMMSSSAKKLKELGIPEDNIYLSMERNMNCGIGLCGHCQMGRHFICKGGPVFSYPEIKQLMEVHEI